MSYGVEIFLPLIICLVFLIIGIIFLVKCRKSHNYLAPGITFTAIGVLCLFYFFFSMYSYNSPLPTRCTLTPDIECTDYRIYNNMLTFSVRNHFDTSASFDFIAVNIYDQSNISCAVTPNIIGSGETADVYCSFDKAFKKDIKVKIEILGFYTLAGKDPPTAFTGEIYTKVE